MSYSNPGEYIIGSDYFNALEKVSILKPYRKTAKAILDLCDLLAMNNGTDKQKATLKAIVTRYITLQPVEKSRSVPCYVDGSIAGGYDEDCSYYTIKSFAIPPSLCKLLEEKCKKYRSKANLKTNLDQEEISFDELYNDLSNF